MKRTSKEDLVNKNVALQAPGSEQAEYFRTLKTNIDMLHIGRKVKSLVITSPTPDSGKTLIASNLAATYAQYDQKTLLIDLDLRMPSIGYAFPETKRSLGLSGLLDGERTVDLEDMLIQIGNSSLYVLPVGRKFSLPHVTINSRALEAIILAAKEEFDMVIIDTPPILAVSDALIVSRLVDGCLMAVKHNYTKHQELTKGNELLMVLEEKYLGVVYNNPEMLESRYSYEKKKKGFRHNKR
ncbi:CpsD/CapB family tyrosine-protein kinase [Enterococcus sp. ZJ1668]|uniref:CpsD/CapB family tyrosine-protein kinase n=1 Tax=Enterococcus sp. ZJ1668 TaxID=2709402 RepID=UPI0013E9CC2D|nr:CpsD/CapB family tyrosine-protein kinase [Enterococcus sp. ZJ1668]